KPRTGTGRQITAVGDVITPVRRGRSRVHPVPPPPRRVARPGTTRPGYPGRRPYPRPDGFRPSPCEGGRIHRVARTVPRNRAFPPSRGGDRNGDRETPAGRGDRRRARRDRTADNPSTVVVGGARPDRLAQSPPDRSASRFRAGDPQEVLGRENAARTTRRCDRQRGLRTSGQTSRPDPCPGAGAAVVGSRIQVLSASLPPGFGGVVG